MRNNNMCCEHTIGNNWSKKSMAFIVQSHSRKNSHLKVDVRQEENKLQTQRVYEKCIRSLAYSLTVSAVYAREPNNAMFPMDTNYENKFTVEFMNYQSITGRCGQL